MNGQAYEGRALPYVLVAPDDFEPITGVPLVILLHGFGANMYDLASLAEMIDETGYVYAFPNAPYPMTTGNGYSFSWATGRDGVVQPPAGTPTPDEMLAAFIAEVMEQTGTPAGDVVLGGFSQGGGVTLRYGLPRPEAFRGLVVMSGAFRDADTLRDQLPAERTQPIFISHGRQDPQITLDRAHETLAFLTEAGYDPAYHEYDMGHQIPPAVIEDLIPWLHAVAPPKTTLTSTP